MQTILSVTQVLVAISMIAIILVQRGAGAAAGSGFGAGASGTVFGARGSGSFLTRTTAVLAAAFFIISMTMAIIASQTINIVDGADLGVMAGLESEPVSTDLPTVPGLEAPASDVPILQSTEGDVPMPGVDDNAVPVLPAVEEAAASSDDPVDEGDDG
jgi:preprotein translocase subunit SecG